MDARKKRFYCTTTTRSFPLLSPLNILGIFITSMFSHRVLQTDFPLLLSIPSFVVYLLCVPFINEQQKREKLKIASCIFLFCSRRFEAVTTYNKNITFLCWCKFRNSNIFLMQISHATQPPSTASPILLEGTQGP